MIRNNAYTGNTIYRSMHLPFIFLLFILFLSHSAYSQDNPEYDEILIYADVAGVGSFELPVVIRDNEVFLAVKDLFDFLKVRNDISGSLDTISGFFINPQATYLIDYQGNRIRFQERIYIVSKGDLIRTFSNLYLKSDYFGRIFGLDCVFNFRSLSVSISSKLELPIIREMKIEEMRRNISRLKGEIKADTSIGRTHPAFRFGMADWSLYANEEINGKTNTTLNLSLGAMIAGGEATATLYYNNYDRFSEKQQRYLWRYVDNDFKPVRQIMAGKINTNAISTIYNPVIGLQFTNTPTTFRRSFGTYKLSEFTEPGWIVELYINNVLVDYVTADASGFFSFDVPLVYGNSSVKLKFYGPWGEEKTKEHNINIPYNFLPAGTLEYNIGAGIVEDTLFSKFSRSQVSYGLSRNITLGAGFEYLSSVTSGPLMPFLLGSFRLTNNMLLSGEYTHGVRAKGTFLLRLPSNIQLDLNYTWYNNGQTAINFNYREERKASLSVPLAIGKMHTYQRFSVDQIILPASQFTIAEWLFSGSVLGVNTNLTTYAHLTSYADPFVYSNLSLAFRLPARFTVMPSVQYRYNQNDLISAKLRIEKLMGKQAYLYFQYEKYFQNDLSLAELGIRYDFSFAQTGLSFRHTNARNSLVQYARGSLLSDTRTGYITADNRPAVGKGGITIIPYLDVNSNGGRDPGEPRASGLNLHSNGGRIIRSEKDTTIRILGLEPYTSYLIELDPDGFESISWRLPVKTISVMVDPEILKVIEVPISVAGEATGTLTYEEEGRTRGLGRMIMRFYNEFGELAGRTLSEEDGFYNYLGLAAGEYTVRPDTTQMRTLNFRSVPAQRRFTVMPGREGDFISGLDFLISRIGPDTIPQPEEAVELLPEMDTLMKQVPEPVKPEVRRDTSYMIVHEVTQELFTVGEDGYAIQLGAFRRRSNAEAFRRNLEALLGKKVEIIVENDLYKVRITGLTTRGEVDEAISSLQKNGITELWLITIRASQRQWMLIEKTDTIARITEVIAGGEHPEITPDLSIQVGAFRQRDYAENMMRNIASLTGKPVILLPEDGYYKVRVTGFESMEELQEMLPVLRKLGLNDIWVPRVRREERQPLILPVIDSIETRREIPLPPLILKPDTLAAIVDTVAIEPVGEVIEPVAEEPVIELAPEAEAPSISLHVGEFRKRSQALRAQRKVESKFGLPVEIYIRWDSYHLVITGFTKREDTFSYYPELAGMGYTNIYVIQQK